MMKPVAVQPKCLLAQGKPLAVLPLLSQLSVLFSAPVWLIAWLWQPSTPLLLLLGFSNADLSSAGRECRMSQPVLCLLGACSHLSKESRAAEDGGRKSETSKRPLQSSPWSHKEQCTALRAPPESFTGRAPMQPHPLSDPLTSLPCSSLLLQMLLLTVPLSRDFCICFSVLLLSVSSCCLGATSPTAPDSNSLSQSLVIYRSASLLHLSQLRPLPLTPPKRQLPPAAAQRGMSRAAQLLSSGRYPIASEHAACPPAILGDIFGSDFSHPQWFLIFFFSIPSLLCGLLSPFSYNSCADFWHFESQLLPPLFLSGLEKHCLIQLVPSSNTAMNILSSGVAFALLLLPLAPFLCPAVLRRSSFLLLSRLKCIIH